MPILERILGVICLVYGMAQYNILIDGLFNMSKL